MLVIKLKSTELAVSPQQIAKVLLCIILAFTYIGLSPFGGPRETELDATGGGSTLRQLIFIGIFFCSSYSFYYAGRITDLKKVIPLLLLVGWITLSILWSVEPGISIRRVMLFLITTLTIFMLVSVLSIEDMMGVLSKLFAALILISFISGFIIPGALHVAPELFDSGIEGNWKGIFYHKNAAGPATVFTVFLALYQWGQTRKPHWLLIAAIATIFLYLTKSKTSLGFFIVSLPLAYFYAIASRNKVILKTITIAFLTVLAMILLSYQQILMYLQQLFYNPEAFTGRSTIWDIMYQAIQDYFFLGMGYGAVWAVGDGMELIKYGFGWVDWVYTLTSGHSGYMDAFLALGVGGFMLTIYAFIISPFMKIIHIQPGKEKYVFVITAVFYFFIFRNLLESGFVNGDNPTWLFFLTFYLMYYLKVVNYKL